jgi:hypothetical protein
MSRLKAERKPIRNAFEAIDQCPRLTFLTEETLLKI